jgi:glycosyltransferase involved in cell wall biosynthesis
VKKNKLKFVFLAPRFHTNQICWVEALLEHDHEVEFNVLFKAFSENYSLVEPTVFSPCKASTIIMNLFGKGGSGLNLYRGFPNPIYYFKSLKKSGADVIVIRDIDRWFSFLGAICARTLRIKIIIYTQIPLHRKYSLKGKLVMNAISRIFNAKFITPVLGEKSEEYSVPKNIFFVPFAVETSDYIKEISNSSIRFLSIGKFEKRKNHLMLLKVIKKLAITKNNFSLTIIGEVSNKEHLYNFEECQQFIEENNIEVLVKVYTNVPNEKIKQFYLDHDVFILPATKEVAAISPLEAMGFGLPVICSNTNGTRYYIENNKTGIIFEDNSDKSLKRAINSLLDESEVHRMKENVRVFAKRNMSKSNFYNAFIDIL